MQLDGQPICRLNLRYSKSYMSSTAMLGMPFLNSAYTYYNLDQHTISIAKPSFLMRKSDVVAIGQGRVPNLTGTG